MKKITPHLWFDKEAKEAAEFYVATFGQGRIVQVNTLHETPSGDADFVTFEILGQTFMAISAGPIFKPNPSVSFMVNFDPSRDPQAGEHLEELWQKLADGGQVLMELNEYPFSKKYGWVQDKFGVSWQLILTNPEGEERPDIIPSLMFIGQNCGKAEEARNFYLEVFKESKPGMIMKYPAGHEGGQEGTVMFADFSLEGENWFGIMDSAGDHQFNFTEGISFIVPCDTQEEIDYYWERLSAVPASEQCGWLKDKYGLSWQITPSKLEEMLATGTPEQVKRVTAAFMQMKKFNLAELEKAWTGEV